MSNQGRMPENVVAFRRQETGHLTLVPPSGGSITNFSHPRESIVISPTATIGTPPSNIVEGLFPETSDIPTKGPSKQEILDTALRAKKAA